MELSDQQGSYKNKKRPENNCSQNSPEEYSVVVSFIDLKVFEDKENDKNIIY
jgi:hypothetical protein